VTLPATRIAVASLDPVFVGLGLSALLLGEVLDLSTLIAAALVIAAIALGRRG